MYIFIGLKRHHIPESTEQVLGWNVHIISRVDANKRSGYNFISVPF